MYRGTHLAVIETEAHVRRAAISVGTTDPHVTRARAAVFATADHVTRAQGFVFITACCVTRAGELVIDPIFRALLAQEAVGKTTNAVTSAGVFADVSANLARSTAVGVIALENRVMATAGIVAVATSPVVQTWVNVFPTSDRFMKTCLFGIVTAARARSAFGNDSQNFVGFRAPRLFNGEVNDKSDIQLLRDYAEGRDEAAFREIVTRHTDFVYSAALRQMGSCDAAADVAQSVFVDLARKAEVLASGRQLSGASLAGWLHRATRFAVLNQLRDARRRVTNERQAMQQLLTDSESASADWEQIRPLLDEALDTLGDDDREALLLRYFKNQNFRDLGLALGISDDAAQKRVSRAVEQLREFFSKRNVTIGASGLVVLVSANAVQSAPAMLATTISTAALSSAAISTSTVAAATKAIAMTTLQKILVTATVAVLAGAGIYEAHQATQLRDQVQTLQQQHAPLAGQIEQLESERDSMTNRLANLLTENARLKSNPERNELLKLRGEVAAVSRAAADATEKTPGLGNGSQAEPDSQRNQTRANLETFFKLTNLSREMADQYVDLEVQMKRRQDERMKALLDGTLSVADAVRQRDQDKQAQEDQRRALLGPAGSTVLDSIADDMRDGVAKRLTSAVQASLSDNPLTQEQSDRLRSAIKAEVAANTMDDTDLFRPADEWTQMVTDRQQHVVQAASEFLTPAQEQQFQFLVRENIKQLLQQRDQRRKALGITQ